jgi:hypothetical protein
MSKQAQTEKVASEAEYISYKLIGEEAERFRRFKKQINLKNNAEVARKALLDQMEQTERSAA